MHNVAMPDLVGFKEPRIWTKPLRRLTRSASLGHEVADFATDILGIHLFPWQRWWLLHALELRPNGRLRYRTVVTLVARQNGKTHLLKVLALWAMYSGRAELVLGAAQTLDISKEAWLGAVHLARSDPGLNARIDRTRFTNGEQELRIDSETGPRYRIVASSREAGRGLSVDLLILDELRAHRDWESWSALSKTTMAKPDGLIVAISNAGSDESEVLNSLRDKAVATIQTGEGDPSLGLFEWSAPEDCELDDPKAWRHANPGLGHGRVTEYGIWASLATDPPPVFRTEVLCQRVQSMDAAVDLQAWKEVADSGTLDGLRDRVAVCLDVAWDLRHVSLVAAAVADDGRARVEVVESWENIADARADLPDLLARVKPRVVGWFPGGPAAAWAADLRGVGKGMELTSGEVPAVCQGLAEQVAARRVLHTGDPLLIAQIGGVSKLYSGDGWRFTRKGVGHCDAVYALAGAVHLARMLPPRVRPMVLVGKRPAA
jgi:Phage Terminase